MLENYIPVLLQFAIVAALAAAILIMSVLFGKRGRANTLKNSAYECGMLPVGEGQARFSVKFYLVAMLFVIFDIEVVFMYPWAVNFREMIADPEVGKAMFWSMMSFVGILFVAYLYALKKGALSWNK